jgi:glycosyltransferase involved in cell wall biosynthesis
VAVDAVRRLAPARPELRLLIAGSGPYEAGVRTLAASAPDNVVLAGHRGDVMEVLDASDVLIQPSRFDAFPTSLLEAMAASVPIVATGVGGILEILTSETGRLLPSPPAADTLAAAIAELAERPDERVRIARAARSRFSAEFSAESWARRLRAVYERMLSTGANSRPIC